MFAKKAPSIHTLDSGVVLDFLRRTLPFNELPQQALEDLAKDAVLDFFTKGSIILTQGVSDISHIHLIQKGGVKLYLQDESGEITLKDFRGEGGVFGALGAIRGAKASMTVEAVEDTFCFLLNKQTFLELVQNDPRLAQYYLKSFSENYIHKSFSELRRQRLTPKGEGSLILFSVQVADMIKRDVEATPGTYSVQKAAEYMARLRIGSLLVEDAKGVVRGIITDKDLRSKVVAKGLEYKTPVREIMTSPVRTIPADAVCFDALLAMMTHQIHHLAVEDGGKIIGVITSHDIMVLQGQSPLYLFREILAQRSFEGVHEVSRQVPQVVRPLIEEGGKANNITRVITVLNDLILDRLLTLLQEQLGPPPVPFCWMLMGSEGRKEQTFRTDQDNALIYADPRDDQEAERAETYFAKFAEEAIEHLVLCGFPRCQGDIMASNPTWRLPYSGWRANFDRWVTVPEPQEVLHSTIFFDFRPGYGDKTLAEKLRDHLTKTLHGKELFFRHLAQDCFTSRPPLSFFRNFIVERDGEHRNRLDLKARGLVPFWDFARLMALRHGSQETNTLRRLQAVADGGHIPMELYRKAREAYEFLMQLRLVHQLKLMEGGSIPNNYVNPAELSDLEKQTLKGAFSVISNLQNFLKSAFMLNV
ncbi:MAG: cyclic nucleotide-binding/CBS domain-containing protein [Desulfovibrionales bacterium]|nr:MAG: cyclic nucleotide-binding/CBS domain-containing protein [Desulfovibrionales bacterium]